MFAGSGGRDGLVRRREAALRAPGGIVLFVLGDGLIDQRLLIAVLAIGRGDLPVGHAVLDGVLEHPAQRLDRCAVGHRALVLDLEHALRNHVGDLNEVRRHKALVELVFAVDENQIVHFRRLAGGERAAAVEQRQRLIAGDAVRAQAVDRLELHDGVLCAGAEVAVGRAGEIAQCDERFLHPDHGRAVCALFERRVAHRRSRRLRSRRGHGRGRGYRRRLGRGRFGNQILAAVAVLRAEGREDRGRGRDGRLGCGRRLRRGRAGLGGRLKRCGIDLRHQGCRGDAQHDDQQDGQRGEQHADERVLKRRGGRPARSAGLGVHGSSLG